MAYKPKGILGMTSLKSGGLQVTLPQVTPLPVGKLNAGRHFAGVLGVKFCKYNM